jgi:hypothetical protein
MAFKVNYGQQRNDRKRAKEARQSERLQRRESAAELRRQQRVDDQPDPAPEPDDREPSPKS